MGWGYELPGSHVRMYSVRKKVGVLRIITTTRIMQYFYVVTAVLLACFGAYAKNDANLRIQQSKKVILLIDF